MKVNLNLVTALSYLFFSGAAIAGEILDPVECGPRAPIYNILAGDCSQRPQFTGVAEPGCYIVKSVFEKSAPARGHSVAIISDGATVHHITDWVSVEDADCGLIRHGSRLPTGRTPRNLVLFIPLTPSSARACVSGISTVQVPPDTGHYVQPDQILDCEFKQGGLQRPSGLRNCHHYSSSVAVYCRASSQPTEKPTRKCGPRYGADNMLDAATVLGSISYSNYQQGMETPGLAGEGQVLIGGGGMAIAGGLGASAGSVALAQAAQCATYAGLVGTAGACEVGAAGLAAAGTGAIVAGLALCAGGAGLLLGTGIDYCGLNPFTYPAECVGSFIGSF